MTASPVLTRAFLVVAAGVLLCQSAPVFAAPPEVDAEVAVWLFERAKVLEQKGNLEVAEQLLIESLEKDGEGVNASRARELLRDIQARRKKQVAPQPPPSTKDPNKTDEPKPVFERDVEIHTGRRALLFSAGTLGFTTGLALAGPEDGQGRVDSLAVGLGVIGAAGFSAAGYWLHSRFPLSHTQGRAVLAGSLWGGTAFGLLGDVVTGTDDTSANAIVISSAIGQLVGGVGGAFYGLKMDPSLSDLALINSAGLYGTVLGTMVAATIAPPEGEACTLQAAVGAVAGLGVGGLLSQRFEVSPARLRWIDLGVFAGAALPWALVYPVIADRGQESDEQIAGGLSLATMIGGGAVMWFLTREKGPLEDFATEVSQATRWIPTPKRTPLGGFSLFWQGRF